MIDEKEDKIIIEDKSIERQITDFLLENKEEVVRILEENINYLKDESIKDIFQRCKLDFDLLLSEKGIQRTEENERILLKEIELSSMFDKIFYSRKKSFLLYLKNKVPLNFYQSIDALMESIIENPSIEIDQFLARYILGWQLGEIKDPQMTKYRLYTCLFELTTNEQIERWYQKVDENIEKFFDCIIRKFSLYNIENIEEDVLIETFKKSEKFHLLLGKHITLNKELTDFTKEVVRRKNVKRLNKTGKIKEFFKENIQDFETILKKNVDYSKPKSIDLMMKKCEISFRLVFAREGFEWNDEIKKEFTTILASSSIYQNLYANMDPYDNYYYFSNNKMDIVVEKVTEIIIEKIIKISYFEMRPLDSTYAEYLAQQYYLDYFKKSHKTDELYIEIINNVLDSFYIEYAIEHSTNYKDFIRHIISDFKFLGIRNVEVKTLEKIISESDKVDEIAKKYEWFYSEFHEEMRKKKFKTNPTKEEIRIFLLNNQNKFLECFEEAIKEYKGEIFSAKDLINECENKLKDIFVSAYMNWNEKTKSFFIDALKNNENFEALFEPVLLSSVLDEIEEQNDVVESKSNHCLNDIEQLTFDVMEKIFSLNEQRIFKIIKSHTSFYVTETSEEIIKKCSKELETIFNKYNLIWSEKIMSMFRRILISTKFYKNLFLSNSKVYQYFLSHRIELNSIKKVENQIQRLILYSKLVKQPLNEEIARMLLGTFYIDEHKDGCKEKIYQYLFNLISDKELTEWIIDSKNDSSSFFYKCSLKFAFWGVNPLDENLLIEIMQKSRL